MDKLSYALGLGIGRQLAQMGATDLNIDDFAAAIKDVIAGNELKVSNREAQTIVQDYFAKQEEKLQAERAENGKAAKEAGEKYLAENAGKDGVTVLPSGLQSKRATAESRKPQTACNATTRDFSPTAHCSTAAYSAASLRCSACNR